MYNILIFGGTTEGRLLAEFCHQEKLNVFVSVATDYGREVLAESPWVKILTARMNAEEIEAFIRIHKIELVVDATHPYAFLATAHIKSACEAAGVDRIRCGREQSTVEKTADDTRQESAHAIIHVSTAGEAAHFLKKKGGNVLLTTGSKELKTFNLLDDFRERVYARVLPSPEVLLGCEKLGLPMSHIIAMQGPFSEEMNVALLRHTKAVYLVTKETGAAGGFQEKISAAKKCGVTPIVIKHPKETGSLSLFQVFEILRAYSKKLPTDFQVILAGVGPGSAGQMTADVTEAIRESDVLIGASRVLEAAMTVLNSRTVKCISAYLPGDVAEELVRSRMEGLEKAVVLFSGDAGFYSGAKKTGELLTERGISYTVLPGISSVSYLASRLKTTWEDAGFYTAHGREIDLVSTLRNGTDKVFLLLSGENGAGKLCGALWDGGFGHDRVSVGENLSYPTERILTGEAGVLKDKVFGSLSLMLIEKGRSDER